jgi:hypothetical protein
MAVPGAAAHSSRIRGLLRIARRDVIVDGRRFFYRFASSTFRGFFDWRIGSSGLWLRRFAGTLVSLAWSSPPNSTGRAACGAATHSA